jgi:hypothetical protein
VPFWGGKKASEPPAWATPLSAEQYALLVVTVGETLDAIHAEGQREAIDTGVLQLRNSDGETNAYGLQNLAQMLAMEPPADWPRLVAEHFGAMLTVDRPPQSQAEALASLRVRMWHQDYVRQLPAAIHKVMAPDLVLALVIDLPTKVMSVKAENLHTWGLTEEAAWSAAMENSRREPFEVVPQTRPDGTELLFLVGDNLYVTSHALWLDERLQIDAEKGALIGIPTRHLLVVLPIHDMRVVQAVGAMHSANLKIYNEGPGSVSPDVFWWRRGTFTLIPIDATVQPMKVTPPDAFVALLNNLAKG